MKVRTNENAKVRTGLFSRSIKNVASVAFWAAIVFMAVATVTVALVGSLRSADPYSTIEYEIERKRCADPTFLLVSQ